MGDTKPLYVIHAYKHDVDRLPALAQQINRVCDSNLLCIGDGIELSGLDAYCINGSRLKRAELGGEWNARWIKCFLESGAPYVVKLDPDSWVNWQPEQPPAGYSGTFWSGSKGRFILGGACALWRDAASRLFDDLLHPRYRGERYRYRRFTRYRKHGEQVDVAMIAHCDLILAEAALRSGVVLSEWNQVKATFREPILSPDKYAIIHDGSK